MTAKGTRLLTIPLPLLSFLAIPFYGGSSTTFSLLGFYMAWTVLVLTHDPLTVELYGTLVLRVLFFLIPALGLLAFDCVAPGLSKAIKSRGERQLPGRLGSRKLLLVVGVAVFNVLLSVAIQAALELTTTRVLHLRSLVKVTSTVPLPFNLVKQILAGLVLRGILHYIIHRYVLHTYNSVLKTWHLSWQHSIALPFSLVAAYDHPINYLLVSWLPTILPAYMFRWHVLTWQIFLVICSLEDVFVFSGYSVLPSTIILAGMARRIDVHFDSLQKGRTPGNFGRFGVLDYLLNTTCQQGSTIVDDIQDEAEKRRFQEHVEEVVHEMMNKTEQNKDESKQEEGRSRKKTGKVSNKEDEDASPDDRSGGEAQSDDAPVPKRRSGRKKGQS